MDPLAFLRAQPPFDRLEPAAMKQLQDGLEIAYQPKDARILQRGGPPNRFLYVIRKGIVRLERDGDLVQVLEEGECFGFPSLIARTSPTADIVAAEDTVLYLDILKNKEALFAAQPGHRLDDRLLPGRHRRVAHGARGARGDDVRRREAADLSGYRR